MALSVSDAYTQVREPRVASGPPPAAAKTGDLEQLANDMIEAIARPALLPRIRGADFAGVAGQVALFSHTYQEFPRSGSRYAVMSTGPAVNLPGRATTFTSVAMNGVFIPGGSPDGLDAYDVATFTVRIDLRDLPAEPSPRLVFRYKFCSEEPPDYWGSVYQDYFVAVVRDSTGEVINNIARLPDGNAFTIDNARPYMNQVQGSSEDPMPPFPTPNDVVFNACTGIHTTDFELTDWLDQQISIAFQIGDVGDAAYDSAVLLDGLEIASGPRPDFWVERVEFNQASQSFGGGQTVAAAQLVSGTRFGTAVRVYVAGEGNEQDPKEVSAALHLFRNGSPVDGSPFRTSPLRVVPKQNPSRTAIDATERPTETLQFHIPRVATLQSGDYQYFIMVDPDNEVDEANDLNNRFPETGFNSVTFHERQTLNVLLIRVTTVDGDGQVVNDFTHADNDRFVEQRRYAYRILPKQVDFWFTSMEWDLDATRGWLWWKRNIGDLSTADGLNELFATIVDRMENSARDYHTVVAMLPCATNLHDGANGWGYVGRPGAVVKTCVNSTLTHEIAHNWLPRNMFDPEDRDHDPTNSGDDGLWVGSEIRLKLNKANMLHVGSNDPWVSPTSYRALFENSALVSSGAGKMDPMIAEGTERLRITGWVDQDDSLVVRPIHNTTLPPTSEEPDGDYVIDFTDADDNVISSFRFSSPEYSVHDGPSINAPFSLVIPRPEGMSNIVFRHAEGSPGKKASGVPLGVIPVSDNSPDVIITAPRGGENVDGVLMVEWDAADPDGNDLFYNVAYAVDGETYLEVASMLTEASFELDTSRLPGGSQARVRVVATDGVNSTAVESASFAVPSKGPDVTIHSPSDDATLVMGAVVGFEGEAFDPEDGDIPGEDLVWSSSVDGELGATETFSTTELSLGTHVITLTATDSDGNEGTASVTLTIVDTTPTPPSKVEATPGRGQVELVWTASASEIVTGYRVYWGLSSEAYGEDANAGEATKYTVSDLTNGTTYYFAVRAYDAVGNLSEFSHEVVATPIATPGVDLLLPDDRAAGLALRPEFQWKAQDGAIGYHLQIAIDETFANVVLSVQDIPEAAFTPEEDLEPDRQYFWQVRAVYEEGESEWSDARSFSTLTTTSIAESDLPDQFALSQNYPNPFNPLTQIQFALPQDAMVRLEVFDVLGRRIAELVNGHFELGYHTVTFDATNLSSGIYLYRIKAGGFVETRRMMIVK